MNLPNADQAQTDRKKITEYLLFTSHPHWFNKAIFFSQFGFTLENWKILAESLRKHGATYNVTKVMKAFGRPLGSDLENRIQNLIGLFLKLCRLGWEVCKGHLKC